MQPRTTINKQKAENKGTYRYQSGTKPVYTIYQVNSIYYKDSHKYRQWNTNPRRQERNPQQTV